MMGLQGLLRKTRIAKPPPENRESAFFSTAFSHQGLHPSMLVPWEARAVEVGAKHMSPSRGSKLLQTLWAKDKHMAHLDRDDIQRIEQFFEFAHVQANRDVIRQDEYGNFMVVQLSGTIAVDRLQPWGEELRLAETNPGEILGEMSLLDSGIRFSRCTTLTQCDLAVLSADGLDDMMQKDPQLAASLIALLAHKLSLRLRAVSARLSEPHNQRG